MNVLIAIDGSPGSEQALMLAGELLPGTPVSVTLLYVLSYRWYFGIAGPMPAERGETDIQRVAANNVLGAATQRLRAGGVGPAIAARITSGEPADLILATAATERVDLIILGGCGANVVERAPLGSVARAVAMQAGCAVLVAHPRPHA
ncbi:MAG: universal stress protein [Chloroflexota bacterium]